MVPARRIGGLLRLSNEPGINVTHSDNRLRGDGPVSINISMATHLNHVVVLMKLRLELLLFVLLWHYCSLHRRNSLRFQPLVLLERRFVLLVLLLMR